MMKAWLVAVVAAVLVATVLAKHHGEKEDMKKKCDETALMACKDSMKEYAKDLAAKELKTMVMENDKVKLSTFCNAHKMAHKCIMEACNKTEEEGGDSKEKPDGQKPGPPRGDDKDKKGGKGGKEGEPKPDGKGGKEDQKKDMENFKKMIGMKMRHRLPSINFVASRICNKNGTIKAKIESLMSQADFSCLGGKKDDFTADRSIGTKTNYTLIDDDDDDDDDSISDRVKKMKMMIKKRLEMAKEKRICANVQSMENKMRCRISKLSTCNKATKTLLAMQYRMFKQSDMNKCKGRSNKTCEKITPEKLRKFRKSAMRKRVEYSVTGDPHFVTKLGKTTCKTQGTDIVLFEKTGVLRVLANITMVPGSVNGSYVSGVHIALLDEEDKVVKQFNVTQDKFDEIPQGTKIKITGTEYGFRKKNDDEMEIFNKGSSVSVAIKRSVKVKKANGKFLSVIVKASKEFLEDFFGVFYDGCPDEEIVETETASTTRRRRAVDTCGCSATDAQCAFDCVQTDGDPNLGKIYSAFENLKASMTDDEFLDTPTSGAGAVHPSIFTATFCMMVLKYLLP